MQTKMLVKKPESASDRTNNPVNNNHKNKHAENKKNVRTKDYKKLLQIMINNPDAITREEFVFLQSIIGLRQAVKIREEAKQRKKQSKIGQINAVMKPVLLEKSSSDNIKDSNGKKETSELKNNGDNNLPRLCEEKIIQRVVSKEKTYIVIKGDVLGGIAIKFNVSEDELVKLNNIKNRNQIREGQVLKIPSTAPEVISEGQTTKDKPENQQNSDANNSKKEETGKVTNNSVVDNFRKDSGLGIAQTKKNTMIQVLSTLLDKGYEPEFAAGVLGNILAEGAAGYFESSAYKKNKEPAYLAYMDKNYNYRDEFSGKHISKVGVKKTYELLKELEKIKYIGKFGLGACQWTGSRTMTLIKCYIEVCGEAAYPTEEQCLLAENSMVVKEINGSYNYVYKAWKTQNSKSNGADAAYSAGSIVCYKYEVPHDTDTQAKVRASNAKKIYNVMMGSN